jgi:hypothetical protein
MTANISYIQQKNDETQTWKLEERINSHRQHTSSYGKLHIISEMGIFFNRGNKFSGSIKDG